MLRKLLAAVAATTLSLALVGVGTISASAEETTDPDVVTTETSVTEPESTEAEPTVPEPTEPESTEPEPTEPESTEPESTEPESTEPESTEPEGTEPQSTDPESTESELSSRLFSTADVPEGTLLVESNGPPIDAGVMVTYCHSPSSETNPWVKITSSVNALEGSGHIDPSENDTHADDIIPPFTYQDNKTGEIIDYPGKNLDTLFDGELGSDILENGCAPEDSEFILPDAQGFDQSCNFRAQPPELVAGYIVVDVSVPVEYEIRDESDAIVPFNAGTGATGPLANGTYIVTATDELPDDGFDLAGPYEEEVVISEYDGFCLDLSTDPVVTPVVETTPLTCEADGSVTLGIEEELEQEVIDELGEPLTWTIDGEEVEAGTHPITQAGAIQVIATPNEGYGLPGEAESAVFDELFDEPTGCDLTTLALTGGDPAGPVTIAALLGLLGVALLRGHRRLITSLRIQ